jgi:hypothetical protein
LSIVVWIIWFNNYGFSDHYLTKIPRSTFNFHRFSRIVDF